MTRGELRAQLYRLIDEDADDPQFLTTPQANALLDEASEVLAEETEALKRRVFLARRPGLLLHSLHAWGNRLMSPYRLYVPAWRRRLQAVTTAELDRRARLWWVEQGEPQVFCSLSWDTLLLWPAAHAGGEIIEVVVLVWPEPLMDDGDTPECPEADHDGLILWGFYETVLKRWEWDRAQVVLAQFMQALNQRRARGGSRLIDAGIQGRR